MINPTYLRYVALGDQYALNSFTNTAAIVNYCETAELKHKENSVYSLSLTSMDGTLLTVIDQGLKYIDGVTDADIRMPTEHYYQVAKHCTFLQDFKDVLGRTRIFKAETGGFWAPHRDGSSTLRVIIPLSGCGSTQFKFLYENSVIPLNHGQAFVLNTLKEHSAFCFSGPSYLLVANLLLNDQTEKLLTKHLAVR